MARLLPLTDRDAEELIETTGSPGARTEAAAEGLLRAARLIDDQPDVVRIELVHPGPASGRTLPTVAVWTGGDRVAGGDDDPFVRRLPSGTRS